MAADRYSRQRAYEQRQSRLLADIGTIPAVANPQRRQACAEDLHLALRTYFPHSTGLAPFGDAQIRMIRRIERCLREGGRFANLFPRGFGKTTIMQNSILLAALYGWRHYLAIFGISEPMAKDNIESIKLELAENPVLYEDFPEVCHAFRALEGKHQRCRSQTHQGRLTHILWTSDKIVFPTIYLDGRLTASSGTVIVSKGITGGVRGLVHKTSDGRQIRPDFVGLDDIQDHESAATEQQVQKRLDIVRKSILRLGGHGTKLAVVLNATVIHCDDLADQLADPKRNPSWQGERVRMLESFARAHDTLWLGEYARIRNTYNPDLLDDQQRAHREATAFYLAHRQEMDEGAVPTWEHCYDPATEVSAIQHAYNILIDDGPDVFASECQNAPRRITDAAADVLAISEDKLLSRLTGLERGRVPLAAVKLTAMIDVHDHLLYWMVCAWDEHFSGYIIDYGTFPDQGRLEFNHAKPARPLGSAVHATTVEGAIASGLDTVLTMLGGREWPREDGAPMRLDRGLVDSGYETQIVQACCRRSVYASIFLPSKGVSITAARKPMSEYVPKHGEQLGHNWYITLAGNRANRYVLIDVNGWKTFVLHRVMGAGAVSEPGTLNLFGRDASMHRMLARHMRSEYAVRTEGRGRVVYEWHTRPGEDNHWFDCVVGCAVGASMCGLTVGGVAPPKLRRVATRLRNLAEMAGGG